MNILGIFAKEPRPGAVKTRLAERLGPDAAATVYEAFLHDLLARFAQTGGERWIGWAPDHPAAERYFAQRAGAAYRLWKQPATDLGGRMSAFFASALAQPGDRAVLIGSDSPSLPHDFVPQAFAALEQADCVLGPATDGGYYLVGFRRFDPQVFSGVGWSQPTTLAQTVDRLARCGLSLRLLPPWYDIDTLDDLRMLAGHLQAQRCAAPETPLTETECWLARRDWLRDVD